MLFFKASPNPQKAQLLNTEVEPLSPPQPLNQHLPKSSRRRQRTSHPSEGRQLVIRLNDTQSRFDDHFGREEIPLYKERGETSKSWGARCEKKEDVRDLLSQSSLLVLRTYHQ